jgi:hypothetical protein
LLAQGGKYAAEADLKASIPLFVRDSHTVSDSMALDRQSMTDVLPFAKCVEGTGIIHDVVCVVCVDRSITVEA